MRERIYRPVKKRLVLIAIVLFAALAGLAWTALYATGLLKETLDGRRSREEQTQVMQFFLKEQMIKEQTDTRVRGFLSIAQREEVSIDTARGMLRASVFSPIGPSERAAWALVFHGGLGTDRNQVLDVACELSLAGYHVITPDLHAHGASEGTIASLGLVDAQDVRSWVEWIIRQESDARIVLFGQDEGAAAVLLAAAQGLPRQVCAAAADSAYRSVKERMDALLGIRASLDRMLLDAAYRMEHGVSTQEGDITMQLAGCQMPLLLIHGTGDADVPAWHSEDLAAAGEDAQLLFVEGAAHGMARYADAEKYYGALLRFYEKALGDNC